jgi:site-specific DNA-methyltransferase (cytosine-N4-specific)
MLEQVFVASSVTSPVADRFQAASWSFEQVMQGREFHPYPARFVSAIPRQALQLLGVKGTVLDPFCGSGTTLMEARRLGLPAVGVDINPVACLISRVRTTRWEPRDVILSGSHAQSLFEAAASATEVANDFKAIPRLDHWFTPHAQRALSGAVSYVRSLSPEDPWRDRVSAAISAATVRVSRQESDTRYAAIEKAGDQFTAAKQLRDALEKLTRWLVDNTTDYANTQAQVHCRDARDLAFMAAESVDAVCFSPPYPNAYEYWLYHKYRMYWLGFDAVAVREQEIGARPHYCRPNGLTEIDFAGQMSEVFNGLRRVMKPGAYAVVVVGDSVIGGRVIDNGVLLSQIGEGAGFVQEAALTRPIAVNRSSFNRAHSRGRKHEHILLLRRPR